MDIELLWSNPLPINIKTPEGEEGKHGIFAFVYDKKEIIYIGKALGSMHFYQESKNRYGPLGRAFEKLGLLNGNASNEENTQKARLFFLGNLNVLSLDSDGTPLPVLGFC